MPTYRIDLAYDGTGFHGYARQPGIRTVQGAFEEALFRTTGEVETVVAGRTDRGVHAADQVISFAVRDVLDPARLRRSLNRQLAPEIAVNTVTEVAEDFSARFSATQRRYRYTIWNGPVHDPLTSCTRWHVPEPLDVGAMNRAIGPLVGEHDFASFCRKAEGRSTERRVLEAAWVRDGDRVEMTIAANAFCHQMVRSIVAVSVEVGRGRLEPEAMTDILEAHDRTVAKGAAPPQGLVLVEVAYDDQ